MKVRILKPGVSHKSVDRATKLESYRDCRPGEEIDVTPEAFEHLSTEGFVEKAVSKKRES